MKYKTKDHIWYMSDKKLQSIVALGIGFVCAVIIITLAIVEDNKRASLLTFDEEVCPFEDMQHLRPKVSYLNHHSMFDRATTDYEIEMSFPKKHQYITAMCTSNSCGGLGDRLKNIMNVIAIGMTTNRKFTVNYTKDFNLKDYYEPRSYMTWDDAPDPAESVYVDCIDKGCECIRDMLTSYPNAKALMLASNADCTNYIIRDPNNIVQAERYGFFEDSEWRSKAFDRWFIPTENFSLILLPFLSNVNFLAVAHIRVGGETLNDPARIANNKIGQAIDSYHKCFTSTMSWLMPNASNYVRMYIASDNEPAAIKLRNYIGCKAKMYDSKRLGAIGHVERMRTVNSDLRMFVDFEMMRRADILYGAESGFTGMAVLMRKRPTSITLNGLSCGWIFTSFTTMSHI